MVWSRSKAARKRWVGSRWPAVIFFLLIAVLVGLAQEPPRSSVPVSELIERGRELLRNRDPQQARQLLEEAVAREPKSPAAWALLADSYSQLGLEEKAIRGYQTTVELRPDSPRALYNLAILHFKRKRFEDAVRYLQTLRRQQPQDQDALLLLAQCLLQLGRHQEAIPLFEEVVRGQRGWKGAYLSLASAYVTSSQNDRAIEVLHQARNLWPDDEEVRSALTRELMQKEDPAGTLVMLRARENKKLLPEDLQLLAGCYAASNRLEQAERLAEQAVTEGGGEPALLALANILQLDDRSLQAIRLLEAHRREFSSSAKYLFTLGLSYYNTGNYSGASDVFSKAISLNPGLAQAHYLKANSLTRLGKPELAVAHYEEAIRLAPEKYLYHFHLGLALSNLGEKDQGEKHLKRSVELNSSYAPARYELARIYAESSRDPLACGQLEEAIKADPRYLSSYYLLSQVYERLGRGEDAMWMLNQFQTMQRQQHEEERALVRAHSKAGKP